MRGTKLKQSEKIMEAKALFTSVRAEPQSRGLQAALLFDPKSVAALEILK